MENEKPNNAVQQKVAQLAARMADQFMMDLLLSIRN